MTNLKSYKAIIHAICSEYQPANLGIGKLCSRVPALQHAEKLELVPVLTSLTLLLCMWTVELGVLDWIGGHTHKAQSPGSSHTSLHVEFSRRPFFFQIRCRNLTDDARRVRSRGTLFFSVTQTTMRIWQSGISRTGTVERMNRIVGIVCKSAIAIPHRSTRQGLILADLRFRRVPLTFYASRLLLWNRRSPESHLQNLCH